MSAEVLSTRFLAPYIRVLLALVAIGIGSSAMPLGDPKVSTLVLVVPNKPIGNGVDVPAPTDFKAKVGDLPYSVQGVTRASESPTLRTIVVFDLAATAPDSRACLFEQAASIAPRLLEKNIELIIVTPEIGEVEHRFSVASGAVYEYFLPDERASLSAACSAVASSSHPRQSEIGWHSSVRSGHALGGLLAAVKDYAGPIRIFWVGQGFEWFYAGQVTPMRGEVLHRRDYVRQYYSNEGYEWMDEITRAGISVSPVSWMNGSIERDRVSGDRRRARDMADYLGGQYVPCDGGVGTCLENALAVSDHGWVLQINGPAVERTTKFSLSQLEITYSADRSAAALRRPFVLGALPPLKDPIFLGRTTDPAVVPLFESEWLTGRPGCEASSSGDGPRRAMTAVVPAWTLDQWDSGLQVQVELLDPSESRRKLTDPHMHLKVRRTVGPPVPSARFPGRAEVCVELTPSIAPTGQYRIILFNPKVGWAGVGYVGGGTNPETGRRETGDGETGRRGRPGLSHL